MTTAVASVVDRRAKGGRQWTIPIHPPLAPLFAADYATRVPLTEQAVFIGVQVVTVVGFAWRVISAASCGRPG